MAAAGLWLALATLHAEKLSAWAYCLPTATRSEDRTRIPNLEGTGEVPFGLWVMSWDSAKLASHVVKILAEEVLGYDSRISGTGSSSASGLYATAGCLQPNDFATDPQCSGQPAFIHHASLEVWGLSKITSMREKLAAWPEVIPEDAGNMGYEGVEGTYIFTQQREEAYQAEGLPLDYYRSYDAHWRTPWQYFDNYTAFDPADLRPCNETRLMDSTEMRNYINVTGDRDGVVENPDGTLSARCWFGSWWFAPACRSRPEQCVPSVTGSNGWFVHDFMQRAAKFNMPMALTVGKTNAKYRSVARQRRCLPYWFQPDSSFIDLSPSILTFPPYNALERAQKIRTSMADNSRLSKWIHNRLGVQASRLRTFLLRVSFTMDSINELLLENKLQNNSTHESVACNWIRGNEHLWSPWIPIKTECIPGMGLASAAGFFVEDRALASTCAWCPPGRHSAEYLDHLGPSHVCSRCQPGRSQPNPGQQECGACDPGRFADAPESQECRYCAYGAFQNNSESTACTECPQPMTTRILGAVGASTCICPRDMYKSRQEGAAVPCIACPQGMECELGSAEEHIPRAVGASSRGEYPRPLPMYYATYSEPLSVYLCLDEVSCPGGSLETCGENMYGAACGRCAEGHYRLVNGGCRKCRTFAQTKGFLIVVVVIAGPVVCFFLSKFSGSPLHEWGSSANAIIAIAFLVVVYAQYIAVVRMCYLVYPERLGSMIEWTAFTLEAMAPVRPECTDFADFELGFAFRLLMPVYALAIFAATWLVSRIVEKASALLRLPGRLAALCHLDGHAVMGCYGGAYNAFFIGIAAQIFALFQCYLHPNGRSSLRTSPDVLCGSEVWGALLWPAVLAIVVFCVGALALFAYVSWKAPSQFHDEVFRRKWAFLFMKFRPSIFWWGMVLLVKGVWINLATVIFNAGHLQLAWLTLGLMTYLVVSFGLLPWRSLTVAVLDVFTHAALVLLLSLLPHFALPGPATAREAAGLGLACCLAPLLGTCAVVLAQLHLRIRPTTPLQWQAQAESLAAVFRRLGEAEEAELVLQVLPTADLWTLAAVERMLLAEMVGDHLPPGIKPSRRLSMRHAHSESDGSWSPRGRPRRLSSRALSFVDQVITSWDLSMMRRSPEQQAREGASGPELACSYAVV